MWPETAQVTLCSSAWCSWLKPGCWFCIALGISRNGCLHAIPTSVWLQSCCSSSNQKESAFGSLCSLLRLGAVCWLLILLYRRRTTWILIQQHWTALVRTGVRMCAVWALSTLKSFALKLTKNRRNRTKAPFSCRSSCSCSPLLWWEWENLTPLSWLYSNPCCLQKCLPVLW